MTYEDRLIMFVRDMVPGITDADAVAVLRRAALLIAGADGRRGVYLWRLRLYEAEVLDDPRFDSQPDSEPLAPPDMTARGFVGIVGGVISCAQSWIGSNPKFAGLPVQGLDSLTLAQSIERRRPALSRKGGIVVWRFPLQIGGAAWMARVDIKRA